MAAEPGPGEPGPGEQAEEGSEGEGDCCIICLGGFERPCLTPCGHTFCRGCILPALRARASGARSGPCPTCRGPVSVYRLRDAASGKALAVPDVDTIYGSVFVQRSGLGVSSLHFDSEEDCYLSFASAPEHWSLDDGSSLPAKKPFTGCSWDAPSRTFRGMVEWDPSFGGNSACGYEIVFADDFCAVVGGHILLDGGPLMISFRPPWDDESSTLRYFRWVEPPGTIYGGVYVQGFSYVGSLEGVASYHFEAPDRCYISYANAPAHWRLDDDSPPPVCKPFTYCMYSAAQRIFCGTVEWDPTTFHGAAFWKYQLTFSEDFSCIVAGTFTRFGPDGVQFRGKRFGDPATPSDPSQMYYVRKPEVLMREPQVD